jgi:hypothetical protein
MLCCMLAFTTGSAVCPPTTSTDYRMHCLYLYKFTQLIKWPVPPAQEFTIGIVGISPVIPSIEQYFAAKNKSSAVKFRIVRFKNASDITTCNLLYVAKQQAGIGFDEILKRTAGKPTLILTEVAGLIKRGACINLISEEGISLKVQINKMAIESHNLKPSPELFRLANEIF